MTDNVNVAAEKGARRKPLVSIIITCYNCRNFVAEAIESALAQNCGDTEVVVVDDGSTDGSPAIAQRYPVRFIQQKHSGISAARNHGISASAGEYIVFLDSDDRLLPDAVPAGLAAFEQHPHCGMSVGAHNFTTESGEWIATKFKPVLLRDAYELLLRSNFIECTSSVMFRRSCFSDSVGFRPNLKGGEDYDVFLRMAKVLEICCHSRIVAEYRLHSSSVSHNIRTMLTDTLAVHSEQWPFARRSLRYMLAYLDGALFWRRRYGRKLAAELAISKATLPPQEYRAACRLLARYYPAGLLVVIVSQMLPKSLVKLMLRRTEGKQANEAMAKSNLAHL